MRINSYSAIQLVDNNTVNPLLPGQQGIISYTAGFHINVKPETDEERYNFANNRYTDAVDLVKTFLTSNPVTAKIIQGTQTINSSTVTFTKNTGATNNYTSSTLTSVDLFFEEQRTINFPVLSTNTNLTLKVEFFKDAEISGTDNRTKTLAYTIKVEGFKINYQALSPYQVAAKSPTATVEMDSTTGAWSCGHNVQAPDNTQVDETELTMTVYFKSPAGTNTRTIKIKKTITFDHWEDPAGNKYYIGQSITGITGEMTLTAKTTNSYQTISKATVPANGSQTGYKFNYWDVEGTLLENRNNLQAGNQITYEDLGVDPETSSVSVQAMFKKICTITYTCNYEGATGVPAVDSTNYCVGDEYRVQPGPTLAGYQFKCWWLGSKDYYENDPIVLTGDIAFLADMQQTANNTIKIVGDDGIQAIFVSVDGVSVGTFTAATNWFSQDLKAKQVVTYTVTAKTGYKVESTITPYTVKGTEGSSTAPITITSSKQSYPLNISFNTGISEIKIAYNGTAETYTAAAAPKIPYGTVVTCTATAKPGYQSSNATKTVTIAASQTANTFAPTATAIQYTITYVFKTQGYTGAAASDPAKSIAITGNATYYNVHFAAQTLTLGTCSGYNTSTYSLKLTSSNGTVSGNTLTIPAQLAGNITVTGTLIPKASAEFKITSVTQLQKSSVNNSNGIVSLTKTDNTLDVRQTSGANVSIVIAYSSTLVTNAAQLTLKCYSDPALTTEYADGTDLLAVKSLAADANQITLAFCAKEARVISGKYYYAFSYNNSVLFTAAFDIFDVPYVLTCKVGSTFNFLSSSSVISKLKTAILNEDADLQAYLDSTNTVMPDSSKCCKSSTFGIYPVLVRTEHSDYGRMILVALTLTSAYVDSILTDKTKANATIFVKSNLLYYAFAAAKSSSQEFNDTLTLSSSNYSGSITLKATPKSYSDLIKDYIDATGYQTLLTYAKD